MDEYPLSTFWGRFKWSGLDGAVIAVVFFPVLWLLARYVGGTTAIFVYAALVVAVTLLWTVWDWRGTLRGRRR